MCDRLISEEQIRNAQREALERRQPFIRYLVEEKHLDSGRIALAAANAFGVSLLDLDAVDLPDLPLNLVDEKLIRKHRALPIFRRGNRLFLGVSDPTDYLALEKIGFAAGLTTNAILVEEAKLAVAIEQAITVRDRALLTLLDTDLDGLETVPEDAAQGYDSELKAGDAPIRIEDPVEIQVPRINQVNLKDRTYLRGPDAGLSAPRPGHHYGGRES